MSQKSVILIVTLFALIVAGMFTYAHLKKAELQQDESVDVPNNSQPVKVIPYADIARIDAKHYFVDGTHTLVGEVNMPTPCDLLEAEALVMESYPEQVTIDFNVINNSKNCDHIEIAHRFKVELSASEEATFSGRFMGREVILNLIPAAEGELPEEFEVFIKG